MHNYLPLATNGKAVSVAGVTLVGISADNGVKLAITVGFIVALVLARKILHRIAATLGKHGEKVRFWSHQVISITFLAVLILGLISIWFNDPGRLATVIGLISAGVAVACQRAITSMAAYFVLLHGRNFHVGDRIMMGGVRGDVMSLGFIQTRIMEMGEPQGEQGDDPSMWVRSRQYTGRIVSVTNDKIFDLPVYNYTHEFPYIWEEMHIPVSYHSDHARAEQILIEVANRHTLSTADLGGHELAELERRYFITEYEVKPSVYYRLTDNWIELSLRFLTKAHHIRRLKDTMSREILAKLKESNIGIASSTYDVVGFPPVRIQLEHPGQEKAHTSANGGQDERPRNSGG